MDISQLNSAAVQATQLRSQGKVQQPSLTPADRMPEPLVVPDKAMLTRAEKSYFANAFPEAATEIHQHVMYQKNGTRQPLSLGTVVDRRG